MGTQGSLNRGASRSVVEGMKPGEGGGALRHDTKEGMTLRGGYP